MNFISMLRLMGLCSFIGGLIVSVVQSWLYIDPQSFITLYFEYMGYILIFIGIIGLYLSQWKEIGHFGLLIFIFVLIGHILLMGYNWFVTFVQVDLLRSNPNIVLPATEYGTTLSLYTLLISLCLFALISIWKGKISRIGSALLLLGTITAISELIFNYIPQQLLIPHAVIGLSFAWLGWSLFYGKIKTDTPIFIEDKEDTKVTVGVIEENPESTNIEDTKITEESAESQEEKENTDNDSETSAIQIKEHTGSN